MKNLVIIFFIILFTSCNVCRIAYKFDCCKQSDTIINYDTVFYYSFDTVISDSSKLILYLDCDSNKIYIRDTIKVGVRPSFSWGLSNNIISITSKYKDTINILNKEIIKYKEIYSSSQKEIEFYKLINENLSYKNRVLTYIIFSITLFLLIIFVIILVSKKI